MKVIFYQSDKVREALIAIAFCRGASLHGVQTERRLTQDYEEPDPDTDLAAVFGVKGRSRRIMDDHLALGRHAVYIDKGYMSAKTAVSNRISLAQYFKVSLDSFQPLALMGKEPSNRWERFQKAHRIKLSPWREKGEHVIWLGPSQKYCDFHQLGDANEYSEKIIDAIIKKTRRPIVYKPKKSWKGAEQLPRCVMSQNQKFEGDLENAWAVVTHGSNRSVAAILGGVPVVAIGPAITRPIADTSIHRISKIQCPTTGARERWLQSICYWQWTIPEMNKGLTWAHLKQFL